MSSRRTSLGIVVGVDGSPPSKVAVDWAARDAALRNLPLTLVHAESSTTVVSRRARRIIDDAIRVVNDSATRGGSPQLKTRVTFADPVATLIDLSRDAEMIVVGSRRRGALRRALRGSVSSAVVRGSHCPVAVIHDEDPLMPDPAHAPVLVGLDGSAASERVTMLARDEASRRGVELLMSDESLSHLIEQSEAAQLVVVGDHHRLGTTVARAARMPVLVAR